MKLTGLPGYDRVRPGHATRPMSVRGSTSWSLHSHIAPASLLHHMLCSSQRSTRTNRQMTKIEVQATLMLFLVLCWESCPQSSHWSALNMKIMITAALSSIMVPDFSKWELLSKFTCSYSNLSQSLSESSFELNLSFSRLHVCFFSSPLNSVMQHKPMEQCGSHVMIFCVHHVHFSCSHLIQPAFQPLHRSQ